MATLDLREQTQPHTLQVGMYVALTWIQTAVGYQGVGRGSRESKNKGGWMSCPTEAMAVRAFKSHCQSAVGYRSLSEDFCSSLPHREMHGLHRRQILCPCPLTKIPAHGMPVPGGHPSHGKREPSPSMSSGLGCPFPGLSFSVKVKIM